MRRIISPKTLLTGCISYYRQNIDGHPISQDPEFTQRVWHGHWNILIGRTVCRIKSLLSDSFYSMLEDNSDPVSL